MVTHNNLHSFCYWVHNHVLYNGIHDLDPLDLQQKLFFPPFSMQLMLIHEMGQTWILAIITTFFFAMGTTIMFSSLVYRILMLWIWKKILFSTIFLIMKVYPWNEVNLETCNNPHSFCYRHYNNVRLIRMHNINALDLQKKLFFLLFSLQLKFFYEMRQTWIPVIISIFLWALQLCSPHRNTRYWSFEFARKHFFPPFSL